MPELKPLSIYPFPYQGSKRRVASHIIPYFPRISGRLIEPFAGSAAISISSAHYKVASSFIINDANIQLMRLWKVVIDNPCGLCDSYSERWWKQRCSPRKYYDFIRERYFLHRRASDLFFILHRSANSIVRFSGIGSFNNTQRPGSLGCKPMDVRKRVLATSRLLRDRTMLTSLDYRSVTCLACRDDLVYMDPPYYDPSPTTRNYTGSFSHDKFCAQLSMLNSRGIPYIFSYGNRESDAKNGLTFDNGLELAHIRINSGRPGLLSAHKQKEDTYESLYLSRAAMSKLGSLPHCT